MPFSSVLGASSVIKPGVCTSTTRPTVPYEGQLIYETDTDRLAVYTGSAWSYVTGAAAPPGLVYLTGASFTSVTSVSLPTNTFTSTYRNYKLFVDFTSSSANLTITCRMRSSGTDHATNYAQFAEYTNSAGTAADISVSGATSWTLGYIATGSDFGLKAQWSFDLISPQVATTTRMGGIGGCSGSAFNTDLHGTFAGQVNLSNSFDSLSFIASTGNFTGIYRVYGYADS